MSGGAIDAKLTERRLGVAENCCSDAGELLADELAPAPAPATIAAAAAAIEAGVAAAATEGAELETAAGSWSSWLRVKMSCELCRVARSDWTAKAAAS